MPIGTHTLNEMESTGNGEVVVAFSVDLNENEEGNEKRSVPVSTDCNITEVKSRLLNEGRKAYPTDKVTPAGENTIMIDLVPKSLPGPTDESAVILKQCRDGILNGYPESSVEATTMGSEPEGGGFEGNPPGQTAAVSTDRLREENGMLLPTRVSPTVKTGDSSADKLDKGHLHSEARPKSAAVSPALSCSTMKHQQIASSTLPDADMQLPNGEVDLGDKKPTSCPVDVTCIDRAQEIHAPGQSDNGLNATDSKTNVSNGDLLTVNKSQVHSNVSRLTLETTSGLSDCDSSTNQLENIRNSPGEEESSARNLHWGSEKVPPASILLGQSADVALQPDEHLAELCATLSTTPVVDHNVSEIYNTHSSNSEACCEPRPSSLRTMPSYTVSLSCDNTPLGPGDGERYLDSDGCIDPGGFYRNTIESNRRQSAPEKWPDVDAMEIALSSEARGLSRRHGIAEFFTRGLFSRKPKEPKPQSTITPSTPGWKLFGKIPLRENPSKDSRSTPQECEGKVESTAGPHPQNQPTRRKNLEFEPSSTTALILEDRPANLPAKSTEEALRHRQEYEEMVAGAKRREMREAQLKKRQLKERLRQEESIANAMVIWNTEVLPNWESMKNTRRVRELWWQGLPPSVRGKVWSLAIGNELNITPELYEIFLSRAKEKWRSFSETSSENEVEDCGASLADRESSLDLIKLDISRTFPSLYIFQKGGPYHDLLHSVLGAYTCYRPDVGYVQGMSFIAAVLILNMEEADAFIAFANLLNKPCQMAFFRVDHDLMLKYFAAFEVFFEENLPTLFQHFQSNSLTPDFYLIDWIFTLYSKSLPLDVACRVWDVFCRDGEEALFRTGLGILRLYQDVLLQMDFIHSAQFLSRLPDTTPAHALFNCIANTQMLSNNRRWNQVFAALMKDGVKESDKNNSPALRS